MYIPQDQWERVYNFGSICWWYFTCTNDLDLLHKTKEYLSKNFEMKDMGEASYVIGISIFRDRSKGLLRLSQKAYINKILERFNMSKCSDGIVPIQKGDKFSLKQCPKNDVERKEMENIPYASVVGSLMYLQTSVLRSGCSVDIKVTLVFITGKLQRKYWDIFKEQRITCLLIKGLIT